MKIRAVLFDMDGTLLDTLTDMQQAVNHVLEQYGYPGRSLEEIRAFVGNGAARLIHRALPEDTPPQQEALVLDTYRAWYQAHACVETRPYSGIVELLECLRQRGLLLAVVSNKPDETTRGLAARFFPGLASQGQREGVAAKPAPDMVLAALEQLGVRPEEALYVGDSEVDVETARAAGLEMAAVSWGFRSVEQLRTAGARHIIDVPGALLTLLDELAG